MREGVFITKEKRPSILEEKKPLIGRKALSPFEGGRRNELKKVKKGNLLRQTQGGKSRQIVSRKISSGRSADLRSAGRKKARQQTGKKWSPLEKKERSQQQHTY